MAVRDTLAGFKDWAVLEHLAGRYDVYVGMNSKDPLWRSCREDLIDWESSFDRIMRSATPLHGKCLPSSSRIWLYDRVPAEKFDINAIHEFLHAYEFLAIDYLVDDDPDETDVLLAPYLGARAQGMPRLMRESTIDSYAAHIVHDSPDILDFFRSVYPCIERRRNVPRYP